MRVTGRLQRLAFGPGIAVAVVAVIGCGSGAKGPNAPVATDGASGAACAACLSDGGTWQPEAGECTRDCDIQDISCFRDECPGPCAPGACGSCFASEACETAGCVWRQEAEAMWCTAPAAP